MGGLEQVYETFSKKQRQYNKEEWIEYKKKEKQEVYELSLIHIFFWQYKCNN